MQNSRPLRVEGEMWPYPEMIETVAFNLHSKTKQYKIVLFARRNVFKNVFNDTCYLHKYTNILFVCLHLTAHFEDIC